MPRFMRFAPVLSIAIALVAWSPPSVPANDAEVDLEWTAPGCNDDRDGCGWFSGFRGWDEDHVLPEVAVFSTPGAWWGVHDECLLCAVGNCGHSTCTMLEEEDVEDFEMAMTFENYEGAADLYAGFTSQGSARIHPSRGVVQLLDCQGGVFAQFAVTEAVAALMQQRAAEQ